MNSISAGKFDRRIYRLFSITLCLLAFLVASLPPRANAEVGRGHLLGVRHGQHPGFTRIVFDLRGKGHLRIDPLNSRDGEILLVLRGVDFNPAGLTCGPAGRSVKVLPPSKPGTALCSVKGGMITASRIYRVPNQEIAVGLQIPALQIRSLSYRMFVLSSPHRIVIDIGRLPIQKRGGRFLPVLTSSSNYKIHHLGISSIPTRPSSAFAMNRTNPLVYTPQIRLRSASFSPSTIRAPFAVPSYHPIRGDFRYDSLNYQVAEKRF